MYNCTRCDDHMYPTAGHSSTCTWIETEPVRVKQYYFCSTCNGYGEVKDRFACSTCRGLGIYAGYTFVPKDDKRTLNKINSETKKWEKAIEFYKSAYTVFNKYDHLKRIKERL